MPASVCVSMCLCVYMTLCVCLSVCRWSVWRSAGLYVRLPRSVSLTVVNLSMCLFACLCLSISVCLYLSVYLPACLSVCCHCSRSVVSLSQLSEKSVCPSVSHGVHEACRQRRGGCWKRERKATHTRATDWADECWAKDGGWEQGIESKKLRAEGAVYIRANDWSWGSEHHAESAGLRAGDWEPCVVLPKDWGSSGECLANRELAG